MSELQHALLGGAILMFIWMIFAKDLFKSDKDKQAWEEWKDMFRRYR